MKIFAPWILGVLILSNCGGSDSNMQPQKTKSQEEVLYSRNCGGCHGKDGTLMLGGAANLKYSLLKDEEIIRTVTEGRGTMAAYSDILTEQEISLLAVYVKGLRKIN